MLAPLNPHLLLSVYTNEVKLALVTTWCLWQVRVEGPAAWRLLETVMGYDVRFLVFLHVNMWKQRSDVDNVGLVCMRLLCRAHFKNGWHVPTTSWFRCSPCALVISSDPFCDVKQSSVKLVYTLLILTVDTVSRKVHVFMCASHVQMMCGSTNQRWLEELNLETAHGHAVQQRREFAVSVCGASETWRVSQPQGLYLSTNWCQLFHFYYVTHVVEDKLKMKSSNRLLNSDLNCCS